MKIPIFLILVILIGGMACDPKGGLEPTIEDENCATYIPFYELQDTNATSISIECNCEDRSIDLSTKLGLYNDVARLDFNCDEAKFDDIPTMPSVTHLISDITTSNIQAFPNLEVYQNKEFMENPLAAEILFLPNLREITLFNAINIPDVIGTRSFDIFKMTFQIPKIKPLLYLLICILSKV